MLSNFIRKFTVSNFVYLHMFEWSVFNLEIGMFMSAFYCQAEQTSLSLLFRYETNMKYPLPQVWWLMFVSPALRSLRQEGCQEF